MTTYWQNPRRPGTVPAQGDPAGNTDREHTEGVGRMRAVKTVLVAMALTASVLTGAVAGQTDQGQTTTKGADRWCC